ncbi:MAG: sulfite oxidase [Desulfobacteraceae bacterium]|nr:sulfite oxidase [Desulfobacteraceae bacterium]
MKKSMRIMTEKPLNAETPTERLRTWITGNDVFFDRNQGQIPEAPISLDEWVLNLDGEVDKPLTLNYQQICRMPKAIVANTLECSGNSRSLLEKKASGNPWTIGGVGNAVWGGVWLRDLLDAAGPTPAAAHVAFEGLDKPLGKSKIKFIRSIPIQKAMSSTLLAYEMNGDLLPRKHGFPLRALALGWTGANCVKWVHRITVRKAPYEGFFMDKVYRVFQKGQPSETGELVSHISLNSIITQPLRDERLTTGRIVILGAAYGGENHVEKVDISTDNGDSWQPAEFIGPDEPHAWRHWQYIWNADRAGEYVLMSRATDNQGNQQPESAEWNVLGYGNNGIREHGVPVTVV